MEKDNDFLANNKTATIEEMSKLINSMNNLMIAITETEDDNITKLLFQLFHALGSLSSTYNQFLYLETGDIYQNRKKD